MVRLFFALAIVFCSGCAYTDGMRVNMKPNAESVDFTVDFFGGEIN